MTLKTIVIACTCVVVAATAATGWHGAFAATRIDERVAGPYEFVYRTAPRDDFGSVRTITTELERAMHGIAVGDMQPFDVFYPPGLGEANEIGFIVSSADLPKILALPHPPLHRTVPQQQFLTTSLPYRTPFSFLIGFWKVDPALRDYRAHNGLKETWAATLNTGKTIVYLQPKALRYASEQR
jgi:hypothetical protein